MKKKLYKRLEAFFSHWHRRIHPWPEAKDVDYPRYQRAVMKARYCYWAPWGWLPWSGVVIRKLYG